MASHWHPYTVRMTRWGVCIKRLVALAAMLSLCGGTTALAQGATTPQARVIVSLKASAATLREHAMQLDQSASMVTTLAQRRADAMARHAGVALSSGRLVGERGQVLTARGIDSAALAKRLASHPDVEFAVIDKRRRALRLPNDPLYAAGPSSGLGPAVGQWYLRAPSATVRSAINAEAAWDLVNVNAALVVAVLDTGVLADHIDLAGRVLPGYDMIDNREIANDGNGRDADASDPGDWITRAEDADRDSLFYRCGVDNSSWHGTQMAGLIGAIADNAQGMAGAAAGVRILPLRVLGKCGGYDSDILAGIYWAAGVAQPGMPANPTPARVLNMSLGSDGACDAAYLAAVRAVTARGAVIVAAAGNGAGHAVGAPGNCAGVIAVTGLRHVGSKVGFSDIGPEVTLGAPGGNCVNIGAGEPCLYPILTTKNLGTQGPVAGGSTWSDAYSYSVGTSFSTPLVSATVALMLSAQPQLTAAQIIAALKRSARPFPTTGADNGSDPTPVSVCRAPDGTDQLQCYCTETTCGAGMLDAAAAVQTVLTPDAPAEMARQLMDFGERRYPHYFPDRGAAQSSAPFIYRYYPSTGAYLGVVVQGGSAYVMNGVYVLGGPFGEVLTHVGLVSDFLQPAAAAAAAAVANPLRVR